MRKTILSFAYLCSVVALAAEAPDSIAGWVYFEESVTSVRTQRADARILRPDGTFRGIYAVGTYGTNSVESPSDGTWTYRKTGATSAELVFDGTQGYRVLSFSNESAGTISGASIVPLLQGTFKLVDPGTRPPLVNCSNRCSIEAGRSAVTGFVVTEKSNAVLIRAIGPSLRSFGISQVLGSPTLRVFSGQQELGWSSERGAEALRRTSDYVGAFPLSVPSGDAATLMILPAGAYTAQVSGGSSSEVGEVLIEVYVIH
jgi:hypothetical protein